MGQGAKCGLGAAPPPPPRGTKAAAGQPGWLWDGEGVERRELDHGARPLTGTATPPSFINSNYFPFPFIMINTWRLCWIKYWLLLNIFIKTHRHIKSIYRDFPPNTHTSQTFFLAQSRTSARGTRTLLTPGKWEECKAEGLVSLR